MLDFARNVEDKPRMVWRGPRSNAVDTNLRSVRRKHQDNGDEQAEQTHGIETADELGGLLPLPRHFSSNLLSDHPKIVTFQHVGPSQPAQDSGKHKLAFSPDRIQDRIGGRCVRV